MQTLNDQSKDSISQTDSKENDFNRDSHPERQEDEVFVTNTDDEPAFGLPLGMNGISGWDRIGWKTKRKGSIAYDIHGEPLGGRWPSGYPVFAKKSEIEKVDKESLKKMLPKK